jgi:hypothetical protein
VQISSNRRKQGRIRKGVKGDKKEEKTKGVFACHSLQMMARKKDILFFLFWEILSWDPPYVKATCLLFEFLIFNLQKGKKRETIAIRFLTFVYIL